MKSNRWSRFFIIFVGIIGFVLLLHPLWSPMLYVYLDVSQSPKPVDVIVILGGSDGSRESYAAHLYKQGYAPLVLISGHVDEMDYGIDQVAKNGVPERATLINDRATNTYDEAKQVLDMLLDLNAQSVLIITNHFHTRRAIATYRHVFRDSNIDLTMCAPDDGIDATFWWKSKYRKQIAVEYIKIPYYWLNYGIWSG